ncbi:hypothetical protein FF1_032777 [Malus domestica]
MNSTLAIGDHQLMNPFMRSSKEQFVCAFDGFKVLELPYEIGLDGSHLFSMFLFLSDEVDGLPTLIEKVCSGSNFLDHHVPHKHVLVASEILKDMGLVLPFDSLTEMVESPASGEEDPCLSQIFHK